MKIGPGQGEKSSPLLLYRFCINGWLSSCQCLLERCEVAIQQAGFLSLTLPFSQTTADEVGDVLHSATTADILEIDRSNLFSAFRKTEVGELCIAVDKCLVAAFPQESVDRFRSLLQRKVSESLKFIRTRIEMPISPLLPQAIRLAAHESCVKVGQPTQTGQNLLFSNTLPPN